MLTALCFLLAAGLLARLLRPSGLVEGVLFCAPILAAVLLATGYSLSAMQAIARFDAWTIAGGAALSFAILVQARTGISLDHALQRLRSAFEMTQRAIRCGYINLSLFERRVLIPCLVTAAFLWLVNLDLALNTTPHNWDSMTYHLARMAYYLQKGNLANYGANYWAQVTHPKNATVWLTFTYLASGRNENLTQLVQFIAYGVATLSVYGIARRMGCRRFGALFAAAVFALLIENLMQAITTQNDMLLTAFIGCAVYGLLAFRERRQQRGLALSGLSLGIALGIKSSALLVMPSIALVALYALWNAATRHFSAGGVGVLAVASSASIALFALPAGYIENWQRYGHPVGPMYVRQLHSFEGASPIYVIAHGSKNLLRFGFEFLSLDGMPPVGGFQEAQLALREYPKRLTLALGMNLEDTTATRAPFSYSKPPQAHEDTSYWGVFGFALLLPLVMMALAGMIHAPAARVLAAGFALFVLAQAFSGPYDPWRGRYFTIAGIFATPVAAFWIGRSHHAPTRFVLIAIVLLGCFSALAAVLGRTNNMPEEVYRMDRAAQLTRNRRAYTEPVRRFEQHVPSQATVAVFFGEDMFEYPLFGVGLTRRLIPVNPFDTGPQPIPSEADFLIYSADAYLDRHIGDIYLGEDWYLRALAKSPRVAVKALR